jgi:peptidyl-prolyl cis-trans isomerase C
VQAVKHLLREPRLHFLLLGAALFVAYAGLKPGVGGGGNSPYEIVLTLDDRAQLDLLLESQWNLCVLNIRPR